MRFIVCGLLLLLAPGFVFGSVSLGVSPGMLNYEKVLKGGYARRDITVSTSKAEPVLTTIELGDQLKGWISLEPNTTYFNISRDKPYKLAVIVKPPTTAENGNHSTIIHIRTQSIASFYTQGIGSAIKADISLRLNVEVTGQQIASCHIGGLDVGDNEVGYPVPVYATVANDGNVELTPRFEVSIWDQMRENVLKSLSFEEYSILPTLTKRFFYSVANTLEPGQYWMSVNVPQCGFSETKTFDIVEQGQISDKGELLGVNTKPWAKTDELVPIIGVFRNTGPRPEDVKLRIVITKNKQPVKVIETETLSVPQGATQEFKQFFIPPAPGRYEVRAVAYYNKKLTFEKGGVINVKPKPKKKPDYILWGAYGVMLLAIVFLVKKIIKEKQGW